jgi:hypothetical protein
LCPVARISRYARWARRRTAYNVDRAAMRATWFARETPNFFVIGAAKAGSSALFSYLLRHPSITGCKRKEVHYFTEHYIRGENWYRGQFPLRSARNRRETRIIGDGTPNYLFDPRTPERLRAFAPEAKLIAILRDPVTRALSHYHESFHAGLETLSLREALDREPDRLFGETEKLLHDGTYVSYPRLWYSYIARGFYMDQIQLWLRYFSRQQLLVLVTEDLLGRPEQTMRTVHNFLGADDYALDSYPLVNTRAYPDLDADLRDRLASVFHKPNLALYEYLGRDLGWTGTSAVC